MIALTLGLIIGSVEILTMIFGMRLLVRFILRKAPEQLTLARKMAITALFLSKTVLPIGLLYASIALWKMSGMRLAVGVFLGMLLSLGVVFGREACHRRSAHKGESGAI